MAASDKLLKGARQGKTMSAEVALEISGSEMDLQVRGVRHAVVGHRVAAASQRPYSAPAGVVRARSRAQQNAQEAGASAEATTSARPQTAASVRQTTRAVDSEFVREALRELSMTASGEKGFARNGTIAQHPIPPPPTLPQTCT